MELFVGVTPKLLIWRLGGEGIEQACHPAQGNLVHLIRINDRGMLSSRSLVPPGRLELLSRAKTQFKPLDEFHSAQIQPVAAGGGVATPRQTALPAEEGLLKLGVEELEKNVKHRKVNN